MACDLKHIAARGPRLHPRCQCMGDGHQEDQFEAYAMLCWYMLVIYPFLPTQTDSLHGSTRTHFIVWVTT